MLPLLVGKSFEQVRGALPLEVDRGPDLVVVERAGYVERVVDPSDARARLVKISARGAEVIPIARAEEAKIEAEWTEHLGSTRMAQLREALTMLRELTDPYRTSSG